MHGTSNKLLLVPLLLLLVSRPVSAALPLDTIGDEAMRTAFRQVGLQVMFGDSLNAMVNANRLGWEVFNRGKAGKNRELAYSMALQAVAEAALGMEREALWHWEAAQLILPELRGEMMHSYSEIGKVFDSTPFRNHQAAVEWLMAEDKLAQEGPDTIMPKAIERVSAVAPKRKPSALMGQRIAVTYLVNPEGRPQAPMIAGSGHSELVMFTVLQALMSWRYEPAQRNGQPAWAMVTTNFSFQKDR